MTGRGVAIQGGLALLALGLAYTTWQRSPELSDDEVFILSITKNDLEKVRYEDTEFKSWTELGKGKDDQGSYVTVRLSGYDNSGMALPSGHPGIALKQPERLVRANEAGARLFERFAPLRAARALGVLDAGKLKELGLDNTKKFLEVTSRGVKHRYAIVPAPPGGNDPYIRNVQDNRVFIINRQILSDLQAASTNLVERRLHAFRIEDVDRVVISGGGKRKELVASRFEEFPGVRLAPAETPDKPDETLKNWHDRVFSLFPAEVMGKDEVPTAGAPVVALKLEYSSRGRGLGWLELARNAKPAQTSNEAPSPEVVFARSEFTAGWVKLSGDAQGLLSEGEKLLEKLAGPPPAAPKKK
jgi:hypothetical protein